eukprot:7986306-Pyramimonas_sp.AAC.1
MRVSIPRVLIDEAPTTGNEGSPTYQCVDRQSQILLIYDSESESTEWLDSFKDGVLFQVKLMDIRTTEMDAIATDGMGHTV